MRHRVRLAGYDSWSCRDRVGDGAGDLLLSFPVPNHSGSRWLIALGDVSGRGELAVRLRDELTANVIRLAGETPDPAAILDRLNGLQSSDHLFATLVLAVLDGDRHELTVSDAGHPSPLLRRRGGEVLALGEKIAGFPLWVDPGQVYEKITVQLAPGEVLVFWTDGETAQLNPHCEIFGYDRLLLAIKQGGCEARSVGESIVEAAVAFRGGRE